MSASLVNVATTDNYVEANTIARPAVARVRFQVFNAAIRYQLGRGWPPQWTDERFLAPGFHSFDAYCTGVRVRSAAPGAPAQVSVDLVDEKELGRG